MNKETIRQLKAIVLPSIIFITIGFLSIYLLDKAIIRPVMVIIIVLLDFLLYMFLVVIAIKGYKFRYLFLGKKYNNIKIDFVSEKIQKDYYRKTGKSIRDNYEYHNYIEYGYKNRLINIINNFKYETASKEEKTIFILYRLYLSFVKIKCDEFKEKTSDFSKDEIINLLSSIRMTEELKAFINRLVNDNFSSIEAYKYVSELGGIIRYLNGMDNNLNELFFKDVLYDLTRHKRYYPLKKDERFYVVCVEEYSDFSYFFKWNTLEQSSIYETYELAYKECVRLASLNNNSYEDEVNIAFKSNRLDRMWYLYSCKELEDDIYTLCDYYSMIEGEGHQCYFSNNEDRLENIINSLKNVLPEAFFKVVNDLYNSYGTDDEGKYGAIADNYFYKHEKELEELIEKYADEI
ncbi:MAG: hypothetical protein ACI35W_04490 [Anaeroplasmataceae bacterium]